MPYIPVFVSSTFRDFHGERDVIRRLVKPALDEAVAPFGAAVELLDLRWGVDTTTAPDDDRANQLVLDVCLDEVDRSRPLFLGLIGDRFGWVPPARRLSEVLERFKMPASSGGPNVAPSVTALEILHGVVNGRSAAVIARRHLRGLVPADWRDADDASTRWLFSQVEQAAASSAGRISLLGYEAHVEDGRVLQSDLERFATDVSTALTPLVVARAREVAKASIDPYESAVTLLAEARRRVFTGRAASLEAIDDALRSGTAGGAVLTAPSGAGKTSALIATCDILRSRGMDVASAFVGVGPRSSSTEDIISRLASQLGLAPPTREWSPGSTSAVGDGSEGHRLVRERELLAWWGSALAGLDRDVVLAVDGLDRLDPGADRDDIPFVLARARAPHVKYILSTTMEPQCGALEARGVQAVALPAIAGAEAEQAVRGWAAAAGRRTLPDAVVQVLTEAPRSPLWLTLAVEELGWLQHQDFRRAETMAGVSAAEAITHLLADTARALPDSESELAGRLLDRAAGELPTEGQAGILLAALGLTRSGLTPGDLEELSGGDPLQVSRARWILGQHVVQRDMQGRIAFHHEIVANASLATRGTRGELRPTHERIAAHLGRLVEVLRADLPDQVVAEDLVWHASLAGRTDLLVDALALAKPARRELVEALADVLCEAVLASRRSGDAVIGSIQRLPIETAAPDEPAVIAVLTAALERHGRSRLRFHESSALVEALLGLVPDGPEALDPVAPNSEVAADALLVAGQTLADGVSTGAHALEVLERVVAGCQRAIDRGNSRLEGRRRLVRARVAIAELLAPEARTSDFAAAAVSVANEMIGESLPGLGASEGRVASQETVSHPGLRAAREAEQDARVLANLGVDDPEGHELLARSLLAAVSAGFSGILPKAIEAHEILASLRVRLPDSPTLRALQVRAGLEAFHLGRAAGQEDRRFLTESTSLAEGLATEFPTNEEYWSLVAAARSAAASPTFSGTYETHVGAGSYYKTLKRKAAEDPNRRSLSVGLAASAYRYAAELESAGRPWAAAKVRVAVSGFRLQTVARLAKRMMLWPSLSALGWGLIGLIGWSIRARSTYASGRGPHIRMVYRDPRTGQPVVSDSPGGVLWEGWAVGTSIRNRIAVRLLPQALATALLLLVAVPAVIGFWSQQRWVALLATGLALGWQQFSRAAAEWWDGSALPGKASSDAEAMATALIEESRAPAPQQASRGLDKDYRGLVGQMVWQSPAADGEVVDLRTVGGVVFAGRPRIWGSIEIVSAADGQRLHVRCRDEGMTGRFSVSPNTARLVTAMEDGQLAIWDTTEGQELTRWRAHRGRVTAVAFSPDGALVASGSSDHKVRIWDPESRELVAELHGHAGPISDCAFHPSARQLVSASWDGRIAVWGLKDASRILSLRAPRRLGYPNRAFASRFTPDGAGILGMGSAGRLRVWDATTCAIRFTVTSSIDGRFFATDPTGRLLAVPWKGDSVRIVDLDDGRELARAALPSHANSVAWHSNGSTVLVGTTRVHAIEFPGLGSNRRSAN